MYIYITIVHKLLCLLQGGDVEMSWSLIGYNRTKPPAKQFVLSFVLPQMLFCLSALHKMLQLGPLTLNRCCHAIYIDCVCVKFTICAYCFWCDHPIEDFSHHNKFFETCNHTRTTEKKQELTNFKKKQHPFTYNTNMQPKLVTLTDVSSAKANSHCCFMN